jgi:hypothetical protein
MLNGGAVPRVAVATSTSTENLGGIGPDFYKKSKVSNSRLSVAESLDPFTLCKASALYRCI